MVRVGSLLDLSLVSPDEIDNKSGLDPAEQLQAIYEAIPSLLEIKGQLYSRVSTLLAQAGVQDLSYDDLTAEEQAQVDDYFRAVVLPVLSPQIVGQRHPSPRLDNKALYITALLRSKSGKAALGFVPCPASLPPIFPLPGKPRALPAAGDDRMPLDADPLQKIHGGGALRHQRHPQRRPELRPGKI